MFRQIVVSSLFSAALASHVFAASHGGTPAPAPVMDNLKAFGALDIEALMATYSDDAAIITPEGVFVGKDAIRGVLEPLVKEFSQPGISIETDAIMAQGDTTLVVWHGSSPDSVYDHAAETFVVEGGKIVRHTYSALSSPR